MSDCFCYIVECADGTFYTGWTTDPSRREHQHNLGNGAKYTSMRRPVRMVYIEPQPDRSSAMRRERQIKTYSHAKKKAMIQSS
jgi:putative endonuclease